MKVDDHLLFFTKVMSYLWKFFPRDYELDPEDYLFLPFTLDAVYNTERLHDLCSQTSQTWPEVYKSHPSWANPVDKS